MNRLVNLKVLLAIATAVAFFIFACSGNNNIPPEEGGEQGDSSSSTDGNGQIDPPYSSSTGTSEPGEDPDPGAGADPSSSSLSPSSSSGGSEPASSSSAIVYGPPDPNSFTETETGFNFDMLYIPGGTFTLGCEDASGCPPDTRPVEGVQVSNYFIGKNEVTEGLWKSVMGSASSCLMYSFGDASKSSCNNIDWYQAIEFACELSKKTGKNYRMTTEAEWEYAAKNHRGNMEKIGSGEEWAYNSWQGTHTGGVNPIGPKPTMSTKGPILHTQKTRRDANGSIVARLIRSIDGMGPALRLAISADMDFPPDMLNTCNIHPPKLEGGEPKNSYRDHRWVTGSDSKWSTPAGATAIGSFELRVWEDGTARFGRNDGQWFTSNNITFVFVPNSSSAKVVRFAYIFLDEVQGSLITDQDFDYMSGAGYVGRIVKGLTDNYNKPAVSGLMDGEALAKAQPDFESNYKMVNMVNIPDAAKKQDPRLLDGPDVGWFQDNRSAGGVHHYRKDVDSDEFRFTVNQGTSRTILANGTWFTVNNTFLRVTHKDGYVAEYLYAVTPGETFYHNSFMGYERADFRMFKKTANFSSTFQNTCGSICEDEIPKNGSASMYSNQGAKGKSTFVPAPN